MSTAVADERKTKLNQLEQLKKFTKVVADTADFESIKDFKPEDATTNPSLVYAATQKQQYAHLLDGVLADRKKSGLSGHAQIEDICDHLLVQFGTDILEIVPGRVSTETDARLSFDVEGSIKKARQLIKLYQERKIPRERVLIKIASTWEGLNAKRRCNSSRPSSAGFTIGIRKRINATTPARKIRVCNRSRKFTPTTRSLATRLR